MEEKVYNNSTNSGLELSPARSETRSSHKYSKRSYRTIKETSLLSISCSKDSPDTNKLNRRSKLSPEIQKRKSNYVNNDYSNIIQLSGKHQVCNKCGYEACACLPKLIKYKKNQSGNKGKN